MLKLSPDSLDWALTHIEKQGDTDIFPQPFEYEAIRFRWDDPGPDPRKPKPTIRDFLSKQDIHSWTVRPFRRCLSPKHRFGFRVSTQLDPLDAIFFTALLYDIGEDIESVRIAATEEIVHSYRFKPDSNGRLFDPAYTYGSFVERSRELSESCEWVVVADIADFFPRIYSHPLENALATCTSKSDHATAIKKLIGQWNYRVSYGIPVGPAVSRLLSELVISDVDAALLSEGQEFCRFSDDYRIFCADERSAYEALAILARTLFENHGLTLQQIKTRILTKDHFKELNDRSEGGEERKSLSERFKELLVEIGITDWYEPIEYDELPAPLQKKIDSLNLVGLLEEQMDAEFGIDVGLCQFALRRLAQLDDDDAVEKVLDGIVHLYPVFRDVMAYLMAMRGLDETRKHELGGKLLSLVDDSVVGHLEYHRLWLFHIFTQGREWDNEDCFVDLLNRYRDEFSTRELILALGRAHQSHWFKLMKREFHQFRTWERRAFLAAASCLPGDEGKFWYQSVSAGLDELERAIVDWVRANPF